jgi:predicted ATPase/DNA-binding SARP family transcriptional activator
VGLAVSERVVEFRLLGSLDVRAGVGEVDLPEGRARALLGLLVLNANTPVGADRIVEELWAGGSPDGAQQTVQVYVSRLRRAFGADLITREPAGYRLNVDPASLDVTRFEELATAGREELKQGDPAAALEHLRAALALWRGPALADFAYDRFAQAEIARLEELRIAAVEDRIEAELALGLHAEVIAELEALITRYPLRERLRGQLMLALYRSGRQAEALEAYREARSYLIEELGLEPGPSLQRLQQQILGQDALLAPPRATKAALLPAPPTPLLGRERELAEVAQLIRETRLLTLTGVGGIGKSRLALECAHRIADAFQHGAAFVDLTPVASAELVASAIAQPLGVKAGHREAIEDVLARRLAWSDLLLVLDNVERLVSAAPAIARLLQAAPKLRVLATSRVPLRIAGEHVYELDELDGSTAVALFAARAEAVGAAVGGDPLIAEICDRLDRLPLAIELAAARANVVSTSEMAKRVERRFELTSGSRDALEHHRSLRAMLDWSHDLLSEAEQTLLARLGAFVGGWTLDAAEAVADDIGVDVLLSLGALAENSLIRRGPSGRFSILETVREYALARLEERGEVGQVRDRHRDYFAQLAMDGEAALRGPDQKAWLERLEDEFGNLRLAFEHALATDPVVALQIATSTRALSEIHGHLTWGRSALERALAAADSAPPDLRATASNGAGILAGEQGDFDAARGFFEETLRFGRRLEDPGHIGVALTNLGNLELFAESFDTAEAYYEEALECFRGQTRRTAIALQNLGLVTFARGDGRRARELYGRALACYRECGDRQRASEVLAGLAIACLTDDDAETAAEALADSLAIARELGDRHGLASVMEISARLADMRGDAARGAYLLGAAGALRESIGARRAPDEERTYEQTVAAIRAALPDDVYDVEVARGRAAPMEDALRDAAP